MVTGASVCKFQEAAGLSVRSFAHLDADRTEREAPALNSESSFYSIPYAILLVVYILFSNSLFCFFALL